MEKNFNEQESLRFITGMIAQAKERFRTRNGNSVILWGYSILILAVANFVLLQVLYGERGAYAYCVWLCTIPLFAVNYIYEARKARKAHSSSYIDSLTGYVWLAYFISNLVLIVAVFVLAVAYWASGGWVLFQMIHPIVMATTGLCLFINGKLYRFRAFVYGSVVFWAGALLSATMVHVWDIQGFQLLVLALCMIPGFILPGHILNRKSRQDV